MIEGYSKVAKCRGSLVVRRKPGIHFDYQQACEVQVSQGFKSLPRRFLSELAIKIYRRQVDTTIPFLSNFHRGSTPMPLWRMGYSGFFRCCTVRAALAPRERLKAGERFTVNLRLIRGSTPMPLWRMGCTSRTRTPAAPSAAPGHGSLQALSDTPSAVSIARPPPHPWHADACRGPFGPEKPSATAEQHRQPLPGRV